ncbi:SH3 type 3 domain protein [Gloeothece citriformis PCC 7424]|uniref:SH3 type 3 domain protein n=1 Tax=Gloeothece citriformis (strain PCC 7424) TaxID=65393 RepID=B7KIL1_GLOC7|nr:SH3 domain-containing protein [Gloeothece citriformis]ACK69417.1 SH3 type 3 domain protein [Gloeothece citriformis PCC 7424]
MGRLSGLFQFILGFFLGVFLLAGGTAALGFVFFSRMAAPPPKPLFDAEKPQKDKEAKKPAEKASEAKTETKAEKPAVKEESKPEPSPQQQEEQLPPGAYKATVSWPEGLSLRDQAGPDATRIGGIMYNDEIVVLQTSADGGWQKIRLSDGQEGWIKAGNVEKVSP